MLLRVFPVRTCSSGVFKRAGQVGRPCLLGYIDKCSAPCVGRVDAARHREIAEDFCDFMAGRPGGSSARSTAEMKAAAAELDFERAARLRDDIGALERVLESRPWCCPTRPTPTCSPSPRTSSRWRSRCSTCATGGCAESGAGSWSGSTRHGRGLVETLLAQVYGEAGDAVPREVLVPALPEDAVVLGQWLAGSAAAGVDLRSHGAGTSAPCMETVARNASQSLASHKVAPFRGPHHPQPGAPRAPGSARLDQAPLRIECFDI